MTLGFLGRPRDLQHGTTKKQWNEKKKSNGLSAIGFSAFLGSRGTRHGNAKEQRTGKFDKLSASFGKVARKGKTRARNAL
jgi:hypothetical protein